MRSSFVLRPIAARSWFITQQSAVCRVQGGVVRVVASGQSCLDPLLRSANKYSILRRADNRVVADSPAILRDLQTAERQSHFVTCLNSAELAAFRIRRLSHRPLKSGTRTRCNYFMCLILPSQFTHQIPRSKTRSADNLANKAYRPQSSHCHGCPVSVRVTHWLARVIMPKIIQHSLLQFSAWTIASWRRTQKQCTWWKE